MFNEDPFLFYCKSHGPWKGVGNSLSSSCWKKTELCVGTKRKLSKSNRGWSRELIKSQLPHAQSAAWAPLIAEVSPWEFSRHGGERLGLVRGGRGRLSGQQSVCCCALIEVTRNCKTEFTHSLAHRASVSCLEIFRGLPQNLPDCLCLEIELSRIELEQTL